MKNNPLIIVPFTLPWNWSAGFQRETCFSLIKLGYQVIAYMHEDAHFFLKKKKIIYPKMDGIIFYIPTYYIPFRRFKIIEKINEKFSLLLFALHYLRQNKIIWIFDPQFHYFPVFFPNDVCIYDCVDFHGMFQIKPESLLKSRVNAIFTSSAQLQKLHSSEKTFFTDQGCRIKKEKIITKKMFRERVRIGYVGAINYRFNFKLLEKIVSKNKQWIFELVGPIQQTQRDLFFKTKQHVAKLASHENVHFQNFTKLSELAIKISEFDICIIPYDTNQKINYFSYPLKTLEYFYFQKPVLSTSMPALVNNKEISSLIYFYDSEKEFSHSVSKLIKKQWSSQNKLSQYKIAKEHNWDTITSNKLRIISAKIT